MKEFEKWFLKGGANINKHKAAEQNAWQAALKWVLKSQNLHLKTMLIQEIKKELKDETTNT